MISADVYSQLGMKFAEGHFKGVGREREVWGVGVGGASCSIIFEKQ